MQENNMQENIQIIHKLHLTNVNNDSKDHLSISVPSLLVEGLKIAGK